MQSLLFSIVLDIRVSLREPSKDTIHPLADTTTRGRGDNFKRRR